MGHNKLFRNFIILQEDTEYFKQKNSENKVSGYAKIEAKGDKCKVSFYVQNLKVSEKYYMILISYKKDNRKIINLGSFDVDNSGKAELANEYYINNIAGLNFSFEQISGAAICKKENSSLIYILYGFSNGESVKNDWKNCKVYDHDENKEKYLKEESKCSYEKKKKENIKDDDKHKCSHDDNKHKNEHKDSEKDKCNKNKDKEHKYDEKDFECSKSNALCKEKLECKDKSECKEKSECKNESKRNIFDQYELDIEKQKQRNERIDPYNFELKGKLGEFFEGVVKDFKQIKNKFKEIKYCKWYKADVVSIDDMCDTSDYNKYTIAYYPMINYYPYIKKYGYFMLGYKCDKLGNLKYIVYGVPGTKGKESQPYGGKTGFVTWMKTDSNGMGLWLMFYDYKKSIVVVPKKE